MYQNKSSLLSTAVLITCVLMLIAIILPSIARQRSLARAQQCANNLKQLGLALHNYHSAYKRIPPASGGTVIGNAKTCNLGRLGFLVGLTPFCEQQRLWEMISNPNIGPSGKEFPPMGPAPWHDPKEYEPWARSPNTFRCPDNAGAAKKAQPVIVHTLESNLSGEVTEMTNYVACFGDGTHMAGQIAPMNHESGEAMNDPQYRDWERQSRAACRGMFVPSRTLRFRDILDGLSNTAMFAETQTSIEANPGLAGIAKDVRGLSDNPSLCLHIGKQPNIDWWDDRRGARWADGAMWITGFQTVLPPNSPSCASERGLEDSVVSASSNHAGGVFVAMADGAVVFIKNDIDCGDPSAPGVNLEGAGASAPGSRSPYGVWGAMGTRASKERVEVPMFRAPAGSLLDVVGILAEEDQRPLSTWTDRTGKIKLSARFIKITDKKTIELKDSAGVIHRVPLNDLSDKDIFRAVALDLGVTPIKKARTGRNF